MVLNKLKLQCTGSKSLYNGYNKNEHNPFFWHPGSIDWGFYNQVRSYQQDISPFVGMANAVGCLQRNPEWSIMKSLEILVFLSSNTFLARECVYIFKMSQSIIFHQTDCPSCWLLRPFAALLLPLSYINMDLVVEYFLILYYTGRSSTASLLMALIALVTPSFTRLNAQFESTNNQIPILLESKVRYLDRQRCSEHCSTSHE